jgi:hypothetical protein
MSSPAAICLLTQVSAAAAEADEPEPDAPPYAVGQARRAVREVAVGLDAPALPGWASLPLPDDDLALITEWAAAATWPDAERVLLADPDVVTGPTLSRTVTVMERLFPGRPDLLRLPAVLVTIHEYGLEPALELVRADDQQRVLLTAWFAAADWPESFGYLRENQDALRTPEVFALLAGATDPTVRLHVAILELLDRLPMDAVEAVVIEPAAAIDRAWQLLDAGDLAGFAAVPRACPQLEHDPSAGPILILLLVFDGRQGEAMDATRTLTATIAEETVRAFAVRLRRLLSHPELPGPLAVPVQEVLAALVEQLGDR